MNNFMPPLTSLRDAWAGSGGFSDEEQEQALIELARSTSSYDLKGCADDKTLSKFGQRVEVGGGSAVAGTRAAVQVK